MRILYGGSVKADNAAELLALPDVDGALVGGALARGRVVRDDRRRAGVTEPLPGRLPRRARRLGARAGRARQRDLAGRHAGVRRAVGALPAHAARRLGRRASACPTGQMGNSEVGHLNLGAGAVVQQDLARIDDAVARRLAARERGAASRRSASAERVHLIGLVSDGGVHSGWEHLRALIELGAALGAPEVVVHAFTDGRDTLAHRRRRLPRDGRGLVPRRRATPASARSSGATSRWTATSAGTAPSRPTT